ncbi:MAG: hypothetical protein HY290_15255 [Planctomycetia bacterium]|nr:hypothetical protein [Planctomycetia bacterium]
MGRAQWGRRLVDSAAILVLCAGGLCAAPPGGVVIEDWALVGADDGGCTHLAFGGERQIITAGNRLLVREGGADPFRASPVAGLNDAHSVVYNPRDKTYYVADSGNHRLVAILDPSRAEIARTTTRLAGVALDRPHDIVFDDATGWMYALNPNRVTLFRFKGFGEQESALDLSEHLGYSRALSIVEGKVYVIGSSRGCVVAVDDFDARKFRVITSHGKRRDAPAGSWTTTGLVLNDADFYRGFWYATSYFCPQYAAGTDCNENKLIRFKTWIDFEAGRWDDLSSLLPRDIVPYYLTPRDGGLFLAAFYHEGKGGVGNVFRITDRAP